MRRPRRWSLLLAGLLVGFGFGELGLGDGIRDRVGEVCGESVGSDREELLLREDVFAEVGVESA